ncbi:hypothetical protein [Ligilactobacillus hayakitensis]|uniref:hypothetical protein n=1 Tax=Ligilactobacillus hayakitensis TaxID=396716 RepID=UPI000ACB1E2D|nr:hypothetical protein [Ligilactobacillus hayakitensis]
MKKIFSQFNFWVAIFCFGLALSDLFFLKSKLPILDAILIFIGILDLINVYLTIKVNDD